jgi:Fe-S cluster assembly iron-binding protein IscA
MGLALDEPQTDDEMHDVEGVEIYLDRFTRQVDSITIDYSTHPYFGGFMVRSGAGRDCC